MKTKVLKQRKILDNYRFRTFDDIYDSMTSYNFVRVFQLPESHFSLNPGQPNGLPVTGSDSNFQ